MPAAALFTSKSQEWQTPQAFFDRMNKTYKFTLDVCANDTNAMCERYFTQAQDGLAQSWAGENVWMNPPYAPKRKACRESCKSAVCLERGQHYTNTPGQYDWVKKAYHEVRENDCNVAVCLLPARTDTKLFHDYIMRASLVCFLRGRLRFVGAANTAVFPSMLVTFEAWQRNDLRPSPRFVSMSV